MLPILTERKVVLLYKKRNRRSGWVLLPFMCNVVLDQVRTTHQMENTMGDEIHFLYDLILITCEGNLQDERVPKFKSILISVQPVLPRCMFGIK